MIFHDHGNPALPYWRKRYYANTPVKRNSGLGHHPCLAAIAISPGLQVAGRPVSCNPSSLTPFDLLLSTCRTLLEYIYMRHIWGTLILPKDFRHRRPSIWRDSKPTILWLRVQYLNHSAIRPSQRPSENSKKLQPCRRDRYSG